MQPETGAKTLRGVGIGYYNFVFHRRGPHPMLILQTMVHQSDTFSIIRGESSCTYRPAHGVYICCHIVCYSVRRTPRRAQMKELFNPIELARGNWIKDTRLESQDAHKCEGNTTVVASILRMRRTRGACMGAKIFERSDRILETTASHHIFKCSICTYPCLSCMLALYTSFY